MNVVHFSESPLSSAPYRLMQVQRSCGVNSRLVLHKHTYCDGSRITHPYDILLQNSIKGVESYNKEELFKVIESADVLHFHNFIENHFVFKLHPELKKYLYTKKIVFQVHSPKRNIPRLRENTRKEYVSERLVIAQFQAGQFPDFEVVPNVVPVNDPDHMPTIKENSPLKICFSPSNILLKGWNNKGHSEVKQALAQVKEPYELVIIKNKPFLECLKIKQGCDICIDEVMTGSYHMSSLESLSQGSVVINNINEEVKGYLSKVTGTSTHPMIKASSETLSDVLTWLLKNPEAVNNIKEASRSFMVEHWAPEKINKIFMEIYLR